MSFGIILIAEIVLFLCLFVLMITNALYHLVLTIDKVAMEIIYLTNPLMVKIILLP